MKRVTIDQFLTPAEIKRAADLYSHWQAGGYVASGSFAKLVADEIIRPNIARINKALGQENDPMYLAYCVEYVCSQASK